MKLSVIIPVYNESDTLENLVRRVRAVDHGCDLEIVIVDDGSDDGSEEIADVVFGSRFLARGPHRVLYYWHYLANRMLTALSNALTNLNL